MKSVRSNPVQFDLFWFVGGTFKIVKISRVDQRRPGQEKWIMCATQVKKKNVDTQIDLLLRILGFKLS